MGWRRKKKGGMGGRGGALESPEGRALISSEAEECASCSALLFIPPAGQI